ncbi:MAG: helix-turn-helix transcriptional regulator [Lachnospiraceae bacterium]|nr:helix-turn-helix transcriptional regulator [Lachnospiraceae bacterium]
MLLLGEKIKYIREQASLTQKEFADRIGVAQNTVCNYETNRRRPRKGILISISKEFNVKKDCLFYDDIDICYYTDKDQNTVTDITQQDTIHSTFQNDIFQQAITQIDILDEDAKDAIIKYWNLPAEKKKLFWDFINTFIYKIEDLK